MRRFGLIGYPLGHSFSKGYFARKFELEGISDATYENFEIENIEQFPQLLQEQPDLVGLNVTIPYKQAVIPYLDRLDAAAQIIGAVNTIWLDNGLLKGFNTDYIGFREALKPLLKPHHTKALILGTGGSSKAVMYALLLLGIQSRYVSREPAEGELGYNQLNEALIQEYTLIINTTPLGMYPNVDACPEIPYQYLTSQHLFFDLVYNPAETLFLQKGKAQGAITKNGQEMLELQAEAAWKIWNGNSPSQPMYVSSSRFINQLQYKYAISYSLLRDGKDGHSYDSTQYLTDSNGAFHPTAQAIARFEANDNRALELFKELNVPVVTKMDWMCAPIYRDAIAFFDDNGALITVLNICLECEYMQLQDRTFVDADVTVYGKLKEFLRALGHPVDVK